MVVVRTPSAKWFAASLSSSALISYRQQQNGLISTQFIISQTPYLFHDCVYDSTFAEQVLDLLYYRRGWPVVREIQIGAFKKPPPTLPVQCCIIWWWGLGPHLGPSSPSSSTTKPWVWNWLRELQFRKMNLFHGWRLMWVCPKYIGGERFRFILIHS